MSQAVPRAAAFAAVLAGLALYLFPAARLPLQRTNEAMYAAPPIRMLEAGDYLVPRYENRDFLEKPPLAWWIIAASYRVLGISPFAERLPAVAASLATVVLVGVWVSRRSGRQAGLAAALVLMFTLQFAVYARTFAADAFLTLATVLAAAALDDACRREGSDSRRGLVAGAALALAFGFKGLVGLVLPAGAVGVGLLLDRLRPARLFRRAAWACAALFALLAPWHWAMTQRLGTEFWRVFYWDNQFLRGATNLYMVSPRGPLFYLGVLAWSAFPWSLLVLASLSRRRTSSLPHGLLVFGLVFWSCLVMKREVYLMPLFPAVAVLVAEAWPRERDETSRWRRLPWILGAAILSAAAVFWARGFPGLAALVGAGRAAIVGAGIVLLAAALAAGAWMRRPGRAVPAAALACGILLLALALGEERLERRDPLPAWGERLRRECGSACDGFLLGMDAYSLDFYSRFEWVWVADPAREIPRKMRHRRAFLVMWSELDVMLRELPFSWRVVEKGEVLSGQWAAAALGLRKGSPFRSVSLVEITAPER